MVSPACSKLNVILNEQFGFRARHSTEFQLLRATRDGLASTEVAVFLDIEAVFDTVWHDGQVLKMVRLVTRVAEPFRLR